MLFKLIGFLLALVLLGNCSQKQKWPNYEALVSKLDTWNKALNKKNDTLFIGLEKVLQNPKASDHIKLWYFKALYFRNASNSICDFIQFGLNQLRSNSAPRNWDTLRKKLAEYKAQILRIDPKMTDAIQTDAMAILHVLDSVKTRHNDMNGHLTERPKTEQSFVLYEVLNKIYLTENRMLVFCNKEVGKL